MLADVVKAIQCGSGRPTLTRLVGHPDGLRRGAMSQV